GEAFTRVASSGTAVEGTAPRSPLPGAGAGAGLGAVAGAAPTASPGAAMTATTLPTGTVCPSATATCRSTPSARATRSITALSVSTSASVSPVFTASPSRLCHLATRHRLEDGRLVERAQRPQVEHLGGRALVLGQLLGGLEGDRDRLRVTDERDIAPRPFHLGAPYRYDVLPLRHLALDVVQHLAFE